MTAPLMYGARAMDPTPLKGQTLEHIARCLVGGEHPVLVFGITDDEKGSFLIVTRLTDQMGQAFYASPQVGEWDLHGITNDWTRTVLVWWLRLLWAEIKADKFYGDRSPADAWEVRREGLA